MDRGISCATKDPARHGLLGILETAFTVEDIEDFTRVLSLTVGSSQDMLLHPKP